MKIIEQPVPLSKSNEIIRMRDFTSGKVKTKRLRFWVKEKAINRIDVLTLMMTLYNVWDIMLHDKHCSQLLLQQITNYLDTNLVEKRHILLEKQENADAGLQK